MFYPSTRAFRTKGWLWSPADYVRAHISALSLVPCFYTSTVVIWLELIFVLCVKRINNIKLIINNKVLSRVQHASNLKGAHRAELYSLGWGKWETTHSEGLASRFCFGLLLIWWFNPIQNDNNQFELIHYLIEVLCFLTSWI